MPIETVNIPFEGAQNKQQNVTKINSKEVRNTLW